MDIFDYLKWRGDLSFAASTMCEIDGAVFAMSSYLDYDIALCDGELDQPKNLKYVFESYLDLNTDTGTKMGVIFPIEKIIRMIGEMIDTDRFSNVQISDFVNDVNLEECYQFSAMTFHLDDGCKVVAFRGTDDTVTGWREDFNLTFMQEIPSQKKAVDYLLKIADKYPNSPIYVCGHSKGGNLAVYAAVRSVKISDRIVKVYNFDGPGHLGEFVLSREYEDMSQKMENIIPQSSLVGTMFNGGKFKVVNSSYKGPYQHDLYSWELDGPRFKKHVGLTPRIERYHSSFNAVMSRMTNEEKQKFTDIFFDCVARAGIDTISQASGNKLKTLRLFIRNLNGISREEKELMFGIAFKMIEIYKENDEKDGSDSDPAANIDTNEKNGDEK